MAGISKLFVIGGKGGFQGADGANPIELQIWVGDGDRQWLEPRYFKSNLRPLGKIRTIIPAGPNDPDALLDACIAYYPQHFTSCPSLGAVEANLNGAERLDFNLGIHDIPTAWDALRDEARPLFQRLNIWEAELTPIDGERDDPSH